MLSTHFRLYESLDECFSVLSDDGDPLSSASTACPGWQTASRPCPTLELIFPAEPRRPAYPPTLQEADLQNLRRKRLAERQGIDGEVDEEAASNGEGDRCSLQAVRNCG